MAVYQSPGVYIEEIPSGARPIEGAATSVAAFVGSARRGPAGSAEPIGKLDDYKSLYGDITSEDDAMGLAVQAFYLNGGKKAFICRLAGGLSKAASVSVNGQGSGGANTAQPVLVVSASSVGDWGNDLYIRIVKPDPDALSFDLEVGARIDGTFELMERFAGLDMRAGSDRYVIDVIADQSRLIDVALGPDAQAELAASDYADATLQGGDTGTEATYFTAGLGGATSGTLTLNLNGRGTETITVDLSTAGLDGSDHVDDADLLAAAVQAGIRAHSPLDVFQTVTVDYTAPRFTITAPEDGSVASLAGGGGTLGALMRMTPQDRATLTSEPAVGASGTFFSSAANGVNAAANAPTEISITIDGHGPVAVAMDFTDTGFVGTNGTDGALVAGVMETAIRAARPDLVSFTEATVVYDTNRFVITSGNPAPRVSGVSVAAGNFADYLNLSTGTSVAGRAVTQGTSPVMPLQTLGSGGEGEQLVGGTTVAPSAADYAAFYDGVLRKVPDVTMILLPGQPYTETGPSLEISNTIAFAERERRMMFIADPPPGVELTTDTGIDALQLTSSTYAATYYPWVRSPNPLYNVDLNPTAPKTVLIPPSAFAAGLWTKTDGRRGVWKAPAGVETRLVGASALEFEVEELEQSTLNPRGINCFRKLPSFGSVVWGSRTLATKAVPEWRYVPVRRTALFIEKSIKDGIQWAVFQPNAHPLWASLRTNIGGFMDGLFRAGAFQGEKANDAYFVRCNLGDTMTQADIDRGQVIVIVGFAPLKPAEFVIVRIQQKVAEQ
ncbi:hypothetical protein Dshi_2564 [Dinoroseobacter shibae DFL 12 = DSM 16493]|jgi:phage tail sheath protein FI|uniref:Phage tail sheath protein n=1 Tax=Dinoroseobacter shibae (strain DSM 16493 / NCIMB 14021 / DFL 12) TaxID=398580 RepID=A8LSU8_DINSH|nr:phage tail sheath C-terminal domain-containing protein [Dinoroseobacter shibae]ABV94297.1 hypothetical protein Dshi_2564 [Dinoroseobacter shibae DFL 12 = DSM 16493]URF45732.1 phage tail sheath subtilisin-like domain-containing protein [Dinoroseobacter shibae]URF50037.1 phage tail sheath subtilisin-like domain-containing protein [Dinoroseobacter shibae]